MKKELKEKLTYWMETFLLLGGLAFGFTMLLGGVYALYTIIRAVLGI